VASLPATVREDLGSFNLFRRDFNLLCSSVLDKLQKSYYYHLRKSRKKESKDATRLRKGRNHYRERYKKYKKDYNTLHDHNTELEWEIVGLYEDMGSFVEKSESEKSRLESTIEELKLEINTLRQTPQDVNHETILQPSPIPSNPSATPLSQDGPKKSESFLFRKKYYSKYQFIPTQLKIKCIDCFKRYPSGWICSRTKKSLCSQCFDKYGLDNT